MVKETITDEELDILDKNIEHASNIWKDFENCKAYQDNLMLESKIKLSIDFYEGRQWPAPTEETKHLPRPVINVTSLIIDNKVGNVLSSPFKINYISENQQDTTNFNRFAEWQQGEMGQNKLDYTAAYDGAKKGTYIYHYFWDEKARGKKGNYQGALKGEIIDVRNFFVENPCEKDLQRQEWIIISSREKVSNIKEMADESVDKKLIEPDDNEIDETYEDEESKLATILLRYFRIDGEVYFEKICKQTIITKPVCINPIINEYKLSQKDFKKIIKDEENCNGECDDQLIDKPLKKQPDEELEKYAKDFNRYKASLYPLEYGNWKDRDGCIYGISEVEQIIPNQKMINFIKAMEVLNFQELGMGKIIVKEDTLEEQEIDNTPGQIIVDHSHGQGWGITKLESSQITSAGSALATQIIELTRTCCNASDIITGDMVSKDLSGTAISQLQAQAQKPIALLQKDFQRHKENIGKILEQFYKLYYEDTDYTYEIDDEEQIDLANTTNIPLEKISKTQKNTFNGKEYIDTQFAIRCEVGTGTQYSEIMAMDTLNKLFLNGGLQSMETEKLEQFIELYPDSAMPFKSKLRAIVKKQAKTELHQYKALAEQQANQLNELSNYNKALEEMVDKLQNQLNMTNNNMQQIENSYSKKFSKQSEYIGKMLQSGIFNNKNTSFSNNKSNNKNEEEITINNEENTNITNE